MQRNQVVAVSGVGFAVLVLSAALTFASHDDPLVRKLEPGSVGWTRISTTATATPSPTTTVTPHP
jgi:hypothetical protein